MATAHVRKGDTVIVVAGKDRGKRGRVLRVIPEEGRVVVERINMIKKHQRPTQKLRQGGIIEREGSIHLSMSCSPIRRATDRLASACGRWPTARRFGLPASRARSSTRDRTM